MMLRFEAGERIGSTIDVDADPFTIGRERDCGLVLGDPEVSRRHARISGTPEGLVVEDLGSTNGTLIDGRPITGRHVLRDGERLQVGDTVLVVEGAARSDRTVISARPPARSQSRIHSALERVHLQRSVRHAFILAGAALAIAIVVVVLAVAGVFDGGGDGHTPTVAEVVRKVAPSTALVISDKGTKRYASGTGWVYDAKAGLVVTNNHVINGGDHYRVELGGKVRPATVVAAAPCEDMAVLRVADRAGLAALPLGAQKGLEQGQQVVAVGYPANASLRDNLSSTAGVVSVVQSSFRFPALDVPILADVVQTDAAINPGNSGGPLVDLDGRLVGMNTAGFDQISGRTIQGEGYAIGVDRLRQMLPGLAAGRSITWTGMGLDYTDADTLAKQGLPKGLLVTNAVPGTPAATAGFGKGTVLIAAINGKALDVNLQSYCTAVKGLRSGQKATFHVVFAGGSTQDVAVAFK
jgi:S1-C subfamily serine protease